MPVVHISPRAVGRALALAVGVLVALSSAGQFAKYYLGHDHLFGLVDRFSLDAEGNVPAWYSSVTLLACAVLIGLIAVGRRAVRDRWWPHWAVLGVIFALLSADEGGSLHELAIEPLRGRFGGEGLLYWTWVIPGMLGVAVLGAVYLRFVVALPRPTRRLFVLSAILFVTGALGMEMLSGPWVETHGQDNPGFVMFWTVEEAMEMCAVAVFAYALLDYMQTHVRAVRLAFDDASAPAAAVRFDEEPRASAHITVHAGTAGGVSGITPLH